MDAMFAMDDNQWVAQCSARLAEHWDSNCVDPSDLDNIALCMAREPAYRALDPRVAAAIWLSPVLPVPTAERNAEREPLRPAR